MKQIEGIDLKKCLEEAKAQVKAELEAQVTKSIKEQIMALEQLKIKANHATTEAGQLSQQLSSKQAILSKIESGDWNAVPDSAKKRDDNAKASLVSTNDTESK